MKMMKLLKKASSAPSTYIKHLLSCLLLALYSPNVILKQFSNLALSGPLFIQPLQYLCTNIYLKQKYTCFFLRIYRTSCQIYLRVTGSGTETVTVYVYSTHHKYWLTPCQFWCFNPREIGPTMSRTGIFLKYLFSSQSHRVFFIRKIKNCSLSF